MNIKKVFGFAFVFFAFLILSINFASAAGASEALKPIVDMISGVFEAVFEGLRPLLAAVLGEVGGNWDSASFMGKILAMIIVASIVYVVLSKSMSSFFDDNKWALWLISIVVPLLGFRFVDATMIQAMVLPSSTFAVAVTAGLPFILYFFLIEGIPGSLKKYAWLLFGVFFLGLYTSRVNEMKGIASGVYPLIALLSMMMMFLDGTLRKWMFGIKVQKASQGISGKQIGIWQNALNRVHDTYTNAVNIGAPSSYIGTTPGNIGNLGNVAYMKDVRYYENEIKKLIK